MFWKSKNKPTNHAQNTPAENLKIAQQAFSQGDTEHALQHVADTLTDQPQNPEARLLLDKILASRPFPLELTERKNSPMPYNIAAIRAYTLWRLDRPSDALGIMTQIYQVMEGLPFFSWLVEWFQDTARLNTVQPDTLAVLLVRLNSKIGPVVQTEDWQQFLNLAELLDAYEKSHQEANFTMMLSIMHRKLGELDRALVLAEQAYRNGPSYFTATVLGNAYKEKREVGEAVRYFREALAFNPQDLAIRLDIGDTLCLDGQLEKGLAAYQEVLKVAPEHEWAYPSFLYYQGLFEPGGDWSDKLEKYARSHPDNKRAAKLFKQAAPYMYNIPEPSDATINLARQITEKDYFPPTMELGLSNLETPSAARAIELIQIEKYGKPGLTLAAAEVQKPDPRLPRGKVDFVLWKYKGTRATPNFPAPTRPKVIEAVTKLALTDYEMDIWWHKASIYAGQLTQDDLNDLLGAMVNPPARVAPFTMWVWLQRVQLAAAVLIARLDSGWEGSVRRSALLSLARGPMDWTVEAAIVALYMVVSHDKVGKAEVEGVYRELFENLPSPGGIPYLQALIFCTFYLNPSPALTALAQKAINKLG
jgi:tetratricopeptide (TPR) repeat protein